MDKRVEKTQKAIKEAFIELRAKKPLEKITVTELCRLACINKSTFYDHYEDIYALSEHLESETVIQIIESIPKDRDYTLNNPEVFTKELSLAFAMHMDQIKILFSGRNKNRLADHLERLVKQYIFQKYPDYKDNAEKNVLLSYCIYGAYNTQLANSEIEPETIIKVLENIMKALRPLF